MGHVCSAVSSDEGAGFCNKVVFRFEMRLFLPGGWCAEGFSAVQKRMIVHAYISCDGSVSRRSLSRCAAVLHLSQLEPEDEIIVSDDCPGGETEEIVRRFAEQDQRVRYVQGPGRGLIANFGYAISLCRGDAIFLSDQDDVWMPGKASKVKAALEAGALLVLHDACVTDADMHSLEPSFLLCTDQNLVS